MQKNDRGWIAFVASCLVMAGCGASADEEHDREPGVRVAFTATENYQGSCTPARVARVNKDSTDLDALYGDMALVDIRDGQATRLPLQLVFRGWNDEGISEDRAQTGLNTQTPCDQLRIELEVDYCFLGATRPERSACPKVRATGSGFSAIVLNADNSQRYASAADNPNE